MKNLKRIVAIIGVIVLLSLYALTFIFAIIDDSSTMNYFMASIVASILIPIFIWTVSFFVDRNRKEFNEKSHCTYKNFDEGDEPFKDTKKNNSDK